MITTELTQQLAFVIKQRHEDEATVLAQAVREGIEVLYRETLVEAYLSGKIQRDLILGELGSEKLNEIEYQRDALKRDVSWGLNA